MPQRSNPTYNQRKEARLLAHKWQILVLCGLVLVSLALMLPFRPASAPEVGGGPPGGTRGWQLVFEDQFGGTGLDTTKWTACNDQLCHGYFGRGEWRAANVFVADGNLQLHARKDGAQADCVPTGANATPCTTSLIKTLGAFEFQYGYMEGRMKLPRGAGLWPAFWAMPVPAHDACNWPPEIDVMEHLGNAPNVVHMFFHHTTPAQPCGDPHERNGATYSLPSNLSDSWHDYAVEWRPGLLIWYIDGVERHRVTQYVPDRRFSLLLDLAYGDGQWNGNQPTPTTPQDSTLLVDHVRVWQTTKNIDLLKNAGFEKGDAGGWTAWGSGVMIAQDAARTATYGVRLNPQDGGVEQVVEGLQPNTTYTLRAWGKVGMRGDSVKIGAKEYGGAAVEQALWSTTYTQGTVMFTTGATNTSAKIFIYHAAPHATAPAYGDDFELVEGSP